MMKVMVVDDEKDVLLLFRQRFRKEIRQGKIEFHFAFSAKEALYYLEMESKKQNCVVLILSDINMPEINGLELLKIIKTQFPNLKVFMITAYGDDENYRLSQEYGADDYIHKPVDFDQLKEKIFNLSTT
jgi:YesN/AraC family two-component response regulator